LPLADERFPALARLLRIHGHQAEAPPDGKESNVDYTHYDYLELSPGASRERIEAAYARVLERFNGGDTGQDLSGLVRMIHAAYNVLADPDARRAYDERLQREAEAADLELKALLDTQPVARLTRIQRVPEPLHYALSALAA
jgi:hypothetical protein